MKKKFNPELKTVIDDMYIKVSPEYFLYNVHEDPERCIMLCGEISKSIKRHVDNICSVGIQTDQHKECKYCGLLYDAADVGEDDEPLCCERATEDWRNWTRATRKKP